MRIRFRPSILLAALLACGAAPYSLTAQDSVAAAEVSGPEADLADLLTRIRAKMGAGESSPEALAPETAAFDELLAKYADDHSGPVADIAMMQAVYTVQVLEDEEAALALLPTIKTRFPGTEAADFVDEFIARVETERAERLLQENLVGNPAPQLHFDWASRAGLTSLDDLKGKVVVLDFWATWCGPCISSFPQVRELTAHYAGSPVEVVGVTSLQGRVHGLEAQPIMVRSDPAKEHELTARFAKEYDVTWTVAFSQEEVFNPAYGITGIPHMVMIAPDGTIRQTGLHPAMPHAEKVAMVDAILREFNLPVPTAE